MVTEIIYPELSYEVNGLCFKVHKELGRFKSERSYADALETKLQEKGITYVREKALLPSFKGELDRRNIPDFVIEGIMILDAKAKRALSRDDYFQMKRYLSSAHMRLGLLVNFQEVRLYPKRIVN